MDCPRLAPVAVCGLLLACGEQQESAVAEESAETARLHPWDWEPADPELAAGRGVYLAECALCHDEGEEGAPPLGDREQWDRRSARDLAILLDHAINGFIGEDGEMPARGGTETLSDEEVTLAVRYMLAASTRSTTEP